MLPNTEIKQQEPTKQAPTKEADAPPSANGKKNVTYGFLVGLLAAICYGFIPFFTLPIKSGATENFMSDPTILFYRFGFASIILAIVMLIRRISFKVTRGELVTLIYLAFISDGSALFLIDGYNYMSSGVATTLHFMYPVPFFDCIYGLFTKNAPQLFILQEKHLRSTTLFTYYLLSFSGTLSISSL